MSWLARPAANARADGFEQELQALRQRYAGRPTLRVFYQIWHRPLLTINDRHLISESLHICGARNVFGSGANWRSVARALAPHHRVLCVDLRNHGHSPWTDSMDYLEMADDVRALIARQGLSRPTVVGHSMGGKTAMALALTSPAPSRSCATASDP